MEKPSNQRLEASREDCVAVTVVPNPISSERRMKIYGTGVRIADIMRHEGLEAGPGRGFYVSLDGVPIAEDRWEFIVPEEFQTVEIVAIPGGGDMSGGQKAKLIIGILLSVATIGFGAGALSTATGALAVAGALAMVAAGVAGVVSGIVSLTSRPPAGQGPTEPGEPDDPETAALLGTRNTYARNQSYPKIYGRRRFAGYRHAPPRIEQGDDEDWVNVTFTAGEGPGRMYDFRIGDDPLESVGHLISGIGPIGNQQPFVHEGFDDDPADFQVVTSTVGVSQAGDLWEREHEVYTTLTDIENEVFRVTDANAESAVLNFGFPQGMAGYGGTQGKIYWVAVDMTISFQEILGPSSYGPEYFVDKKEAGNPDFNINNELYLGRTKGVHTVQNPHGMFVRVSLTDPTNEPFWEEAYEGSQAVNAFYWNSHLYHFAAEYPTDALQSQNPPYVWFLSWKFFKLGNPQPWVDQPEQDGGVRFVAEERSPFTRRIGINFPKKAPLGWRIKVKKFGEDRYGVAGSPEWLDQEDYLVKDNNAFGNIQWLDVQTVFPLEKKDDVKNMTYCEFKMRKEPGISGLLENFNFRYESYLPFYGTHGGAPGSESWGPVVDGRIRKLSTDVYPANPNGHLRLSSKFGDVMHDMLTGGYNSAPMAEGTIDSPSLVDWDTENTYGGEALPESTRVANSDPDRECNMVVIRQARLWDAVRRVAAMGRASISMDNNKFTVVPDVIRTQYSQYFSAQNVHNYTIKRFFREPVHGLKVAFKNTEINDAPDEITIFMPGYRREAGGPDETATRFGEIELAGAMTSYEAHREGAYHIRAGLLQREVVAFDTDVEHLPCKKGDLIRVNHDAGLQGISSGHLVAYTTSGGPTGPITSVTLDSGAPFDPSIEYGLEIRVRSDNSVINIGRCWTSEERPNYFQTVDNSGTAHTSDAPQVDDMCWYGEYGEEADDMIVMSVKAHAETLGGSVIAVMYDERIYDLDFTDLRGYEWIPSVYDPSTALSYKLPTAPEIIEVFGKTRSYLRVEGGGLIPRLGVAYNATSVADNTHTAAVQVEVQIRHENSSYRSAGFFKVGRNTVYVDDVGAGEQYQVRLRTIDAMSSASKWIYSMSTTLLPPDIIDSVQNLRRSDDAETPSLQWTYDGYPVDLKGFLVRACSYNTYGADTSDVTQVWKFGVPQHDGVLTEARFDLAKMTPGHDSHSFLTDAESGVRSMWVMVRAVDVWGGMTDAVGIKVDMEPIEGQLLISYNVPMASDPNFAVLNGTVIGGKAVADLALRGGVVEPDDRKFWGNAAEHHWRNSGDLYWTTRVVYEKMSITHNISGYGYTNSNSNTFYDYRCASLGGFKSGGLTGTYKEYIRQRFVGFGETNQWHPVRRDTMMPKFNMGTFASYVELYVDGGHQQMEVEDLYLIAHAPYRTFSGSITIPVAGAGGINIAALSGGRFRSFGSIHVQAVNVAIGDYAFVMDPTVATGPTFNLYNAAGAPVAGDIHYRIKASIAP